MPDLQNRLSLDSVMAVARDVAESEGNSMQAIGIIPSEGDTGYAEIVFAPGGDGSGGPVSVGVSRWESAEQLRQRLVSELRDAG